MDIKKILNEYDSMFGRNTLNEINIFLNQKINEARKEQDHYATITLLNEMMGFCRETNQKERGIECCEQVTELMKQLNLHHSAEYGTTLLNIANLYRAFGLWEKSLETYKEVEKIYEDKLPAGVFHYASLYNNWSVLYQEMQEYHNAKIMILKALNIVDKFEEAYIEQASTRTNLACILLELSEENDEEAAFYLKEALDRFERDERKDYHYSAALSAMGDILYMRKNYKEAASYYKKGMEEIERYVGKSRLYQKLEEKYRQMQRFL